MSAYGLFFLVAVAIGGVAWVFVYPFLSGERKAERRMASVARAEPIAARPTRAAAQKSRREQVEGTLKEIEERRKKAKRPPLSVRLKQAGLDWSKRRFMVTAGVLGVGAFVDHDGLGRGPAGGARLRLRGRLRLAVLAVVVPQEAARSEIPRRCFRTPSTSSCAASRPACRCSTASR